MIRPPIIDRRSEAVRRKIGKNRAGRRARIEIQSKPALHRPALHRPALQRPSLRKPSLQRQGPRALSKIATASPADLAIVHGSRTAISQKMIDPI